MNQLLDQKDEEVKLEVKKIQQKRLFMRTSRSPKMNVKSLSFLLIFFNPDEIKIDKMNLYFIKICKSFT